MANNKDIKNAVGFESKEVQYTEAEIKNNEHIRAGSAGFGGVVEESTQNPEVGNKDRE